MLFVASKYSILTTAYEVIAGFIIGIPTIVKAYEKPWSERSMALNIGLLTWILSLMICFNNEWVFTPFPLHLFLFSLTMVVLQYRKDQ